MTIRFDPHQGLLRVPVRLYGPDGTIRMLLALDTGANETMVNREPLAWLGYDPETAIGPRRITTASGIEVVPRIQVDRIVALGHARRNFAVLCHTLPPTASVDGVLGLDFLRGRRLTVDFREGLLNLE